jgi:hypothetical protein
VLMDKIADSRGLVRGQQRADKADKQVTHAGKLS